MFRFYLDPNNTPATICDGVEFGLEGSQVVATHTKTQTAVKLNIGDTVRFGMNKFHIGPLSPLGDITVYGKGPNTKAYWKYSWSDLLYRAMTFRVSSYRAEQIQF